MKSKTLEKKIENGLQNILAWDGERTEIDMFLWDDKELQEKIKREMRKVVEERDREIRQLVIEDVPHLYQDRLLEYLGK